MAEDVEKLNDKLSSEQRAEEELIILETRL